MSKRGRRHDLMEQALLDGASKLFAVKGFGGTTLWEIARTARVGRTTLYHYFASKEELLVALFEDQTTRSYEDLRDIGARTDLSPRQKLVEAVTNMAMRVLEQPMRFRVVERDEASLPNELLKEQRITKRKAFDELTAIIESGIVAGQFRSVDAQLSSLTIFGMCNWPAWWFNPNGAKSAQEVAALIADFALLALSREDGLPKDNPTRIIADLKANLDRLQDMVARPDNET